MPSAGFFAKLGMFVVPQFFDADTCTCLRREMQAAYTLPAPLHDHDFQERVDEGRRSTKTALMSGDTRAHVTGRLMSLRASLQQHFGVPLAGCQPLQFLIYPKGAHFVRHSDVSRNPRASPLVRQRLVSVSVFLNGEGDAADAECYSGGALSFHASPRDSAHAGAPTLPLIGEQGLLIAFRSDWPHSVAAVERGVRYSVVTWFI